MKTHPHIHVTSTLAPAALFALALCTAGCGPEKLSAADAPKPVKGESWTPSGALPDVLHGHLAERQKQWLEIAGDSFEELEAIWKNSRNKLARQTEYAAHLEGQTRRVKELVAAVEAEGIDNWPMVFDETGLHFAPGLVAVPLASDTYRAEGGHAFTVPLVGDWGDGIPVAELHASAREVIAELAPGDIVFVSMPPGAFSLKNRMGGAPLFDAFKIDNPDYINQTDAEARWFAVCLDRSPEAGVGSEYDLCYMQVRLSPEGPKFLRLSRTKSDTAFGEARAMKAEASRASEAEVAVQKAAHVQRIETLVEEIAAHAWAVYQNPATPSFDREDLQRWAGGFTDFGSGSTMWSSDANFYGQINELYQLFRSEGSKVGGEKWKSLFADDYRLLTIKKGL